MRYTPDRELDQEMAPKCSECDSVLEEGKECLYCKIWCEEELIRRSDDEEAKANLIIQQVASRYPSAAIKLTMKNGNKYIKH